MATVNTAIPSSLRVRKVYLRVSIFTALIITSATVFAQPPFAELQNAFSSLETAIRSQSEASNRPSMAMIDRETARSMNYDNQLKHVRTYFEKRRLNRAYREAERGPRRTREQIVASAKRNAPDRLTVQQFDAYGGRINWPAALRSVQYQSDRQQLDKLFAAHAAAGSGIQTPYYAGIQTAMERIQNTLVSNVKTTNAEQYMYARKFLKSLSYEARFPVGS
ncbi:MAG: hypothetical protein AAFX06_26360 [Planctomycetota bacterium]